MPQSLYVFAVSLQEHPELLAIIIAVSCRNVKGYYSLLLNMPESMQLRKMRVQGSTPPGLRPRQSIVPWKSNLRVRPSTGFFYHSIRVLC
jgi:hypothetical protein